ncbi:MAG: hypothetical protein IJZ89_07815 [Clostridia bacterium]|nr:hypothetical protein [Clostridia bacterium]
MALTADIFNDMHNYIKNNISAVRYVSSEGISTAEIRSVTETENGTVRVEVAIEKSNIRITEIHLYGKNGHLWAKQNVDITLDGSAAGVIYRFEINLKEGNIHV